MLEFRIGRKLKKLLEDNSKRNMKILIYRSMKMRENGNSVWKKLLIG